jgi:hypothetical protein
VTSRRAFGGSSAWWGGRCVPFDPVDFVKRSHIAHSGWPIDPEDLTIYYADAAEFFGIDHADFEQEPSDKWQGLRNAKFSDLERWVPGIDLGDRHYERIRHSRNITVLLNATVTAIAKVASDIKGVHVRGQNEQYYFNVSILVIAAGGVESVRLALSSKVSKSPWLGMGYIGHMSGKIADLVLAEGAEVDPHDFFLDGNHFARRRFTFPLEVQLRNELLNVAFWLDNAPFYSTSHRSSILSAVWIMLAFQPIGKRLVSEGVRLSHVGPEPKDWIGHFANVLSNPLGLVVNAAKIVRSRFFRIPRVPGFLIRNRGGRYALHFHSEQSPEKAPLINLLSTRDPFGTPYVNVGLNYSERDAAMILAAHELLDSDLREAGLGRLEYYQPHRADRVSSILDQASDGYHQVGGLRMADSADDGVVDVNCKFFGTSNLYAASSAVFRTSSQANSTWQIVVLALRLAQHLSAAKIAEGHSN